MALSAISCQLIPVFTVNFLPTTKKRIDSYLFKFHDYMSFDDFLTMSFSWLMPPEANHCVQFLPCCKILGITISRASIFNGHQRRPEKSAKTQITGKAGWMVIASHCCLSPDNTLEKDNSMKCRMDERRTKLWIASRRCTLFGVKGLTVNLS